MDNTAFLRIKNSSAEFQPYTPQVSEYSLKIEEPLEIMKDRGGSFEINSEINIPLNLIKGNSSLQAIVCFLKEDLSLNFKSIADLLNRDQRTVWSSYNQVSERQSHPLSSYSFPIDILRSRRLSVLESIVFYLRNELALSFNEIAQELGKSYMTIWTVYRRALAKIK